MDFNGYNYPFIFQLMIDDPGISPRKLAKHIVSSYSKKIFPANDLGDFNKSITALSAVELFYYFKLENIVNRVSDFLIKLLPAGRNIIMQARKESIINKAKALVDVYTFLLKLARQQQFKGNTLLASLIFSMKEMVLFQTHIGDSFKDNAPPDIASKYRPTGLSIFFPDRAVPEGGKQPGLHKTTFFKNTKWKNFLASLHTAGSGSPAEA
jgi:hypothetical protein